MTLQRSEPRGRSRYRSLQALRAIAAAMVMTHHLLAAVRDDLGRDWYLDSFPLFWGVDLFFVISGAVMVVSSDGYIGQPLAARRFMVSRLIRIVPTYWFFLAIMTVIILVLPSVAPSTKFDLAHVLSSFLFYPYFNGNSTYPILGPGWTLNYEMFFYASFAAMLVVFRRTEQVAGALFAVFGAISIAGWLLGTALPYPFRFWFDSIIIEFLFGVVIGLVSIRTRWRGRWGVWLCIAGFIVMPFTHLLHGSGAPRFLIAGIPAMAVVLGPLLLLSPDQDEKVPDFVVSLGDSSYALYLSHLFVIGAGIMLWRRFVPAGFELAAVLILWPATIIAAELVWRFLERPVNRALRQSTANPVVS